MESLATYYFHPTLAITVRLDGKLILSVALDLVRKWKSVDCVLIAAGFRRRALSIRSTRYCPKSISVGHRIVASGMGPVGSKPQKLPEHNAKGMEKEEREKSREENL
ncbi:hypothetical protein Trydic_g1204 [Trypoxylus dichotomus]